MKNEIKIFKNNEFGSIRTTIINNEVYFVGKEVALALGYKSTADAIRKHVDKEDKLTRCFVDSGQSRQMYVINESGLYSLILKSKLPSAKRFKRWVTSEVLPSIRKYGVYATEVTIDKIINDPDYGIKLLTSLKEEREKRKKMELIAEQRQEIIELQKPKVEYYNDVLQDESLISATELAKSLGISSARKLNQILYQKGVQFKRGNHWLLYALYAERGYTKTKVTKLSDGSTTEHTYWTQKGKKFVYDLLKKDSGD